MLGELFIIGRGPEAQLQIIDRRVSRQHARITHTGDAYVIEDMESGRGTRVNGLPITASRLRPGDEIEINGHKFRFEDADSDTSTTADLAIVMDQTHRPNMQVEPDPTMVDMARPDTLVDPGKLVQLRRSLDALVEVNRLCHAYSSKEELLEAVLETCFSAFPGVERAMAAVLDPEARRMSARQVRVKPGVANRRFHISRWAMTESLGKGRAVLTSEPMKTDTSWSEERTPPQVQKMVVPVLAAGRSLGLIYLDRAGEGPAFTDRDLDLCEAMANAVAMALQNAELAEAARASSIPEKQIEAARQVQRRFLPRTSPRLPGFTFVTHYLPCQDVGGDLYDLIQLDDNRVGVVIGDVAGKGFPAALVMAWVTSQVRLAAHQVRHPAEVVRQVNLSLLDARQDEMFVTLFFAVIDRWTMQMRFCNAGHIPPLVRRGVGPGSVVESVEDAAGMPAGMMADAVYEEGSIPLGKGDVVLLVSDGVTEARGTDDELYGMERLSDSISQGAASPADLVSDILHDLRRFSNGTAQADDVTIVSLGVGGETADIRTTLPPGALDSGFGHDLTPR